jgi:hypothetical protein
MAPSLSGADAAPHSVTIPVKFRRGKTLRA